MLELLVFTIFNSMVFWVCNVERPNNFEGWFDLVTHIVLCSTAGIIVAKIA